MPYATVIPVLIYPDVREAVAWLTEAFGFAERVRISESQRSQLRFGDGALIVADVRGDRRPLSMARSPIRSWCGWMTPARTASGPGRPDPHGADRLRIRRAPVQRRGPLRAPVDVQ